MKAIIIGIICLFSSICKGQNLGLSLESGVHTLISLTEGNKGTLKDKYSSSFNIEPNIKFFFPIKDGFSFVSGFYFNYSKLGYTNAFSESQEIQIQKFGFPLQFKFLNSYIPSIGISYSRIVTSRIKYNEWENFDVTSNNLSLILEQKIWSNKFFEFGINSEFGLTEFFTNGEVDLSSPTSVVGETSYYDTYVNCYFQYIIRHKRE